MKPILLGVNIDHVATLRQARGTAYPDLMTAAKLAIGAGADSITVHLREDRRHIQDKDVFELGRGISVPLNLEHAVTEEMLAIAEELQPKYCCFVPERREELTTEGGLDVLGNMERITLACERLHKAGVKPSLFIDPDPAQIHAAANTGATVIELHTGRYADAKGQEDRQRELDAIIKAAAGADALGLQVNAGHGLNLENVQPIAAIATIHELNIGHAIVASAIFDGIALAVRQMKHSMLEARG